MAGGIHWVLLCACLLRLTAQTDIPLDGLQQSFQQPTSTSVYTVQTSSVAPNTWIQVRLSLSQQSQLTTDFVVVAVSSHDISQRTTTDIINNANGAQSDIFIDYDAFAAKISSHVVRYPPQSVAPA